MVKFSVILLVASLASACSTSTGAARTPERDLVRVLIKADPQLNRFESNAHALSLCLYLLRDPTGFRELVQEKEGVRKLLECQRFDTTVVNAKQMVVQPGQELRETREVVEGARYLAVATGYYTQGKKRVTGLSPLSTRQGRASSGNLVSIELGSQEIRDLRVE